MSKIIFGDNLPILQGMISNSVDLVYIDPPFNTGKDRTLKRIKTVQSKEGDRIGFQGNTYKTLELTSKSYQDSFDFEINGDVPEDLITAYGLLAPQSSLYFLEVFLRPRLVEAKRILKSNGSLYFHIDYREVHYCKILLDNIFGRECFMNEIIWAYDFGGRARSKWPAKHDSILFYVKDPNNYIFNPNQIDREEYMAPGLVGKKKAKRGKLPTDTWFPKYVGKKEPDVWWQTIVPTNSKERTGYPTQKPRQLLDRIIQASTHKNDIVLDFFAGSGTSGRSAQQLGRKFVLIDNNRTSMEIMATRFADAQDIEWVNFDPKPFQINRLEDTNLRNRLEANLSPEIDPEFRKLASTGSYLQGELEEINDLWKDSPFEWVLQLSPRKRGKLGRELLMAWFANEGVKFSRAGESGETLVLDKYRFAIKFSTPWNGVAYKFQQIRLSDYNYLICFGLSPFAAHCWIFDKDYAIKNAQTQHKAEKGGEFWLTIDPNEVPEWAKTSGGSLNNALSVLKGVIDSKKGRAK
ncbi:MAG: site-specific DNA-methyltransferase [Anaerolineales bacterium]